MLASYGEHRLTLALVITAGHIRHALYGGRYYEVFS